MRLIAEDWSAASLEVWGRRPWAYDITVGCLTPLGVVRVTLLVCSVAAGRIINPQTAAARSSAAP